MGRGRFVLSQQGLRQVVAGFQPGGVVWAVQRDGGLGVLFGGEVLFQAQAGEGAVGEKGWFARVLLDSVLLLLLLVSPLGFFFFFFFWLGNG